MIVRVRFIVDVLTGIGVVVMAYVAAMVMVVVRIMLMVMVRLRDRLLMCVRVNESRMYIIQSLTYTSHLCFWLWLWLLYVTGFRSRCYCLHVLTAYLVNAGSIPLTLT